MAELFDSRELYALSEDLGNVPAKSIRPVIEVMREGANELRDKWRANAKATSGDHAYLYPSSIHATTSLFAHGVEAEIGPVLSMKQGFLGPVLEFGGVHSPPHLDGQRAADDLVPRIVNRVLTVAEGVFDA